MAAKARTFSLCDAAHTTAVECNDGKLMLGLMRSLDEVTFDRICAVVGEANFQAEVAAASLLAFVNWTMIPNMTAIYTAIVERVLPKLPANPKRIFFFDLADPEKRAVEDLRAALAAISRYQAFGRVVLGLNLKEAQQVARALGVAAPGHDEATLRSSAAAIRARLAVDTVVVHPTESAACATAAGAAWVPGPFTPQPLITTGAGDHFNAGFTTGQMLGLDAEGCLTLGVATSGHYVRTGESPTLEKLESFLANWR
jgi:sugar/nucleoside kinase (ribokinase family)